MPASKAEQVLDALKTLLETLLGATIERNSVLSEKIPDGGLIVPATAMAASRIRRSAASGARTSSMRSRSRSTSSKEMRRRATLPSTPSSSRSGRRLEADPTLGGLAFGVTYGRPEPAIEAVAGAPAVNSADTHCHR